MMWKEKTGLMRPNLLKFGVALAFSLGGILYCFFRSKRIRSSSSSRRPSDSGNEIDSSDTVALVRSNHHTQDYDSGTEISPNERTHRDKNDCILPEFIEDDFDLVAKTRVSCRRDVEATQAYADVPKGGYKCADKDDQELEIRRLKKLVRILTEKEKNLEIQLLEYYGLKEQEAAVMELQNRLKINNMEARIFTLKIEALKEDKRILEAQVADHAKAKVELEAAKAKIRQLKMKILTEAEQNKRQILDLQKKVLKLHDREQNVVPFSSEFQSKIEKLEDLKLEVKEWRVSNRGLSLENSDLAQRLEYVQLLATSAIGSEEAEALREKANYLKQRNDELVKKVEQLQTDRCSDLEELVYLRWINACLRYELRNFEPDPGKTIARDLSKTLSPRSEEKAKRLILEYADKEDQPDKEIVNVIDFDYDRWSSSPSSSHLTDSVEFEDSSADHSSANKTNISRKRKIFGKLLNIMRGEDLQHHSWSADLETSPSLQDHVAGVSHTLDSAGCGSVVSNRVDAGTNGSGSGSKTLAHHSARQSFDQHTSRALKFEHGKNLRCTRRNSDGGSLLVYRSIKSDGTNFSHSENQLSEASNELQKSELVKYADALKSSRYKTSRQGNRWESFASF